ncbi:hypothetical protein [Streptomyces sp. NPDC017964]|uniref:hypothetical protein n=1 Tax=Streptomyces sp. NPDC017964 TaxID=3365022 RepID=UPI0037B64965
MSQDVTIADQAHDTAARRLEILTFEEAHDLLRLLQLIAGEDLDELSQEAEWYACETPARPMPGDTRSIGRSPPATRLVEQAICRDADEDAR